MSKNDLNLSQHLICTMGAAGLSELVTMPLDTVKVHLQTHLTTSGTRHQVFKSINTIYHNNGIIGFYQSLVPSVTRQMCSSGIRFGLYSYLSDNTSLGNTLGNTLWGKPVMAIGCGLISNFTALPFDVVKTRIQGAQGTSNIVNGITKHIWKNEGLLGFYRGFWQTGQRVCTISAIQLPVYFETQQRLRAYEDKLNLGIRTTLASLLTTIIVTSVVYPIDLCKTQIQNHVGLEQSTIKIIREITYRRGFWGLYQGWSVGLARALPNFWLTTIFFENIKKFMLNR